MNSIFKRTSVRRFQPQSVEPEKQKLLLRAAMSAPSAGDQRPWEFYITEDPQMIEALSKCSPYSGCAKNAPLVIIPCTRTSGLRYPENAPMDMSAAVENILIEAVDLGLGAVWLGIAPLEERICAVRKVLETGDELEPFALIPVGYPQTTAKIFDRYESSKVHKLEEKCN